MVRRCRYFGGSSPHTRGAPGTWRSGLRLRGIIPAYAGSTVKPWSKAFAVEDHPRIRGEHGSLDRRCVQGPGSSPHTRGARSAPASDSASGGIIPAYAGSTNKTIRSFSRLPDHPRIRGEHLPRGSLSRLTIGSSPHTRGALVAPHRRHDRGRIIPAYAGSTIGTQSRLLTCLGSSPHTRGALQDPTEPSQENRIIPAYAGSTSTAGTTVSRCSDHPRIRGEHSASPPTMMVATGSSPHTRGALCHCGPVC